MPLVAGHEGAGIVEAIGPEVTAVNVGDHVGVTWMVACGHCPNCRRGKGNICTTSFDYFRKGVLLDGTSRLRDKNGATVGHGNFVSCFSTHSVVLNWQ